MERRSIGIGGILAFAALGLASDQARAQNNNFGQTIINGPTAAANAAAAGTRAPGNMVAGGVSRATQRITPLSRPEITEPKPPSAVSQTFPQAIDTAFAELNEFLFFLLNQFLQREGLPPVVPGDIINPPDDSTNGDGRSPRDGTK